MQQTPMPRTMLERIQDARQDVNSYYGGCIVQYRRNDGRLALARLLDIEMAGDGDHACRLETAYTNWAAQGYRTPFRVPASRVIAHSCFNSAYFNAGNGNPIGWYCAMLGSRSRIKGVPTADQGHLYQLFDHAHNLVRANPSPLVMMSYFKHQYGMVEYPSVAEALEYLSDEDGVPAVAISPDLLLSGLYDNDGRLYRVHVSACGVPLERNIQVADVAGYINNLQRDHGGAV